MTIMTYDGLHSWGFSHSFRLGLVGVRSVFSLLLESGCKQDIEWSGKGRIWEDGGDSWECIGWADIRFCILLK